MILNKGKYTNIKVALANTSIINKDPQITLYSDDAKTVIGKAKVVDENPLTLDIEIEKNLEFSTPYFRIVPMNYTQQNGYIISIQSLKLVADISEYTPFVLSIEDSSKAKRITRKASK